MVSSPSMCHFVDNEIIFKNPKCSVLFASGYTYKKICISTYFLSENTILLKQQKIQQVNISVVTVSLSDLKYFSFMQAVRIIVNIF